MRDGTPSRSTSAGSSRVALASLEKSQGYIIAISLGGQLRVPNGIDGCISKHAMNRLVEFVALGKASSPSFLSLFSSEKLKIVDAEHPSVRIFARWHQVIFLLASQPKRVLLALMEKEGLGLPLTRLRSSPQRCSILRLAVPTGSLDGSYASRKASPTFPALHFLM
jgi:hypothetical protein